MEDEGPDEAQYELEFAVDYVCGVDVDQGHPFPLQEVESDGDILQLLRPEVGTLVVSRHPFAR